MYQYDVKTIKNKPENTAIWVRLEVNLPDKIIVQLNYFACTKLTGNTTSVSMAR